jgi:hypothetical protein
MSVKSDKLKVLVEFKKRLENKIDQLESELLEMKVTLETLNLIIIEKGFKRGDINSLSFDQKQIKISNKISSSLAEPKSTVYQSKEDESVIPLKTKNGESLAIMHVHKKVLHILPDETKKFNINTPPFDSFLIGRVLMKMKQKDEEFENTGVLTPEKMLDYEIITEGDLLREIVIKNVDGDRLKELRSSIRWTLEKMFEKAKK